MGRILAIDYGQKRTGIAVTDSLKLIAGGLTTLRTQDVIPFLKEYVRKEYVELFILGDPKNMNYTPSENSKRVLDFKKKLEQEIDTVKIVLVDERFTSVLAHLAIRESGLKKKARQNKELVDEISATILLQSYLESIKK